jgi:hypothetical protein
LIANNTDYEPMQATKDMRTFARLLAIVDLADIDIEE